MLGSSVPTEDQRESGAGGLARWIRKWCSLRELLSNGCQTQNQKSKIEIIYGRYRLS